MDDEELSILLAVGALLCAAPSAVSTAPAARTVGTIVETSFNKTLKRTILVDARAFGCFKTWPALITTGQPRAGKGVDASLLGTTVKKDGRLQVTYADHPL